MVAAILLELPRTFAPQANDVGRGAQRSAVVLTKCSQRTRREAAPQDWRRPRDRNMIVYPLMLSQGF